MYIIEKNSTYTYEIKKSKFITLLYKVNNLDEVNQILNNINNEYRDATHRCYGYKIDSISKFSDDGEPGGTAGLPIMEVLNKKDINYILCVVIRYFGGIKLGAGGLVRAYSKAVRDAIDNNSLVEVVDGARIRVNIDYNEHNNFDYLYSKYIKEKEFNDNISYILELSNDKLINFNYKYEILDNIKTKKEN